MPNITHAGRVDVSFVFYDFSDKPQDSSHDVAYCHFTGLSGDKSLADLADPFDKGCRILGL